MYTVIGAVSRCCTDSIHNDGERHIPYIMFLTNGTRSKLAAWAGNQFSDGMLAEQVSIPHYSWAVRSNVR